MERWSRHSILILGTTYPAYSSKYTEVACTGGLREDTCEMVRLHPIPHRYLESDQRFKSFQWITADLTDHSSDPRPESLRVRPDSIELGSMIPSTRSAERVNLLERSPHLMASVEELKNRQKQDGTSLAIIKPKEILGCKLETRSAAARQEWEQKEKDILSQRDLFGNDLKPIDFPETRFKVSWRCDDPACQKPHDMAIHKWGLHELNRKYRGRAEREEVVLAAMNKQLDLENRDVYLFLGSYRGLMYNFGLMDSYSAPRIRQTSLDLG